MQLCVHRAWIDVAAPTMSSSDAAAVGGGLAALMVAANPSLTPEQMKAAFDNGVDVLSSMVGKVKTNVSMLKACSCCLACTEAAAMPVQSAGSI